MAELFNIDKVCGEKIVRTRMAMTMLMMVVVRMMRMTTITMKKLRSVRLAHCCQHLCILKVCASVVI